MNQEEKTISLPVKKMHYSMLTTLLRNPLIFKLKYVLGVYDSNLSVSQLIGQAGHQALKTYYGANDKVVTSPNRDEAIQQAIQDGYDFIEERGDHMIDYGKTGSREGLLKNYAQAMRFYFEEEPIYHKILFVEQKLEAELETIEGEKFPLPAVSIPDLVHQFTDNTEDVEIIDTKFVKSFTDYETEDYVKIIQAMFLFFTLRSAKNTKAKRVVFREIKITENTKENAGMPQIRDYVVPCDHTPYHVIFYNLYKDAVRFISNPDAIYLPNLTDRMDGEQAGLIYAQGLISSDMSDVEVMHKVRDVSYVSKKFVASGTDMVENKYLLPEEKVRLRLAEFGIPIVPVEVIHGSTITQDRFKISRGVRASSLVKHKADIALALEAHGDINIIAPIPGTSLVGVEVANPNRTIVRMPKELLKKGTLMLPIGVDVSGNHIALPLNEMPHLLVAGATGAGKSVLIGNFIRALTSQNSSRALELVLIDPKRVELKEFAHLPHVIGKKVIFEHDDVILKLLALNDEMDRRYSVLEIEGKKSSVEMPEMKNIVVVIDEFADLILRTKKSGNGKDNVEILIIRLAQMGRAAGINLIIATQRPSVDVVTGLIKANMPTRIALTTSSGVDSKVILGELGAEKLAGKGDMLLMSPSIKGLVRLQAYFN